VTKALLKSDGDKGLKAAAEEEGIHEWPCTNHSSQNMAKHTGQASQCELFRHACRAPNPALHAKIFNQLSQKGQEFANKNYAKERSSLAHHPDLQHGAWFTALAVLAVELTPESNSGCCPWSAALSLCVHMVTPNAALSVCMLPFECCPLSALLAAGGCIEHDTTQNAAESTNNTIAEARNAYTPFEALKWVVQHECDKFHKTREFIRTYTEPLPPRVMKLVAETRERCREFKDDAVTFLDATKMVADVTKRSGDHAAVRCRLERVKDPPNGRVLTHCPCGHSKKDGWCDHGFQISEKGGACHVYEMVPYNSTTACWRQQYLVDQADVSFMMKPSEDDIAACDGKSVCQEMQVLPSTQLLPMLTVGRPKGRPSKKDGKRVNPFNYKTAVKHKPKVNTIGELFHVEKQQCKRCNQFGHASGTCQGKGYVTAITDGVQAKIYKERAETASVKRKHAAPEPEPRPAHASAEGEEAGGRKEDEQLQRGKDDAQLHRASGKPDAADAEDADAFFKADSLNALFKKQLETKIDKVITCPGCDFTIGCDSSHKCSFCSRVLHRFCGIPFEGSTEKHGQVVNCKTDDCVQLR
jgi:hypothetical protein